MKSNKENTLNHISFIMDGNGRWAKNRGLPRTAGHSEGVKKAKEVVLTIKELGIPYVSMYTFSKENWKRSHDEVSFLMEKETKKKQEEKSKERTEKEERKEEQKGKKELKKKKRRRKGTHEEKGKKRRERKR